MDIIPIGETDFAGGCFRGPAQKVKIIQFEGSAPSPKKEEKDGIPSMWDYDCRRQPQEFVKLEPETFLEDASLPNLCFLDQHYLIKICRMLSPSDFLNVSLTCRYLHWRMFTFAKSPQAIPYCVKMEIVDEDAVKGLMGYRSQPKTIYCVGKDWRGLFVLQPACLKKPFVFQTLELEIKGIFYRKEDFDRCLPFILAVRKLAKDLKIVLSDDRNHRPHRAPLFVPSELSDFFETVGATSFAYQGGHSTEAMAHAYLWITCPYMKKLDTVWVPDKAAFLRSHNYQPIGTTQAGGSCPNRFGVYQHPSDALVKQTLQEFIHRSTNLEFHAYYYHRNSEPRALLQYLFGQYNFKVLWDWDGSFLLATIDTDEPGRPLKMAICQNWAWTDILVGREETFDKMRAVYLDWFFENEKRTTLEKVLMV